MYEKMASARTLGEPHIETLHTIRFALRLVRKDPKLNLSENSMVGESITAGPSLSLCSFISKHIYLHNT